MPKKTYPTEYATEPGGWTEWIHPLPGYRMSCCDCNLVHEFEFKIVERNKILFRARRANRHTAALRAWKKRKGEKDD